MLDLKILVEISAGAVTIAGLLGLVWKAGGFGTLKKRTGDFLDDWNGEPARPGYVGRKSFPVRMAEVEETVAQLKRNGGESVADAVHQAVRGIAELKADIAANRDALARLDERHNHTDERITDHRKRNEEQAALLRKRLDERNDLLDKRLDQITEDVFRAQAARAILTELGMKVEPTPDGP